LSREAIAFRLVVFGRCGLWFVISRLPFPVAPPKMARMDAPDDLVIGAGIIGCSLAGELARAGQTVVVVDQGGVGCAASSAAAGLLSPTLGTEPSGALVELCFQSAAVYEEWLQGLDSDGAHDLGFRRPGLLEVAIDDETARRWRSELTAHARPGRRVEFLSRQELMRREPALVGRHAGAVFYVDDAQVDAARLVRQVARVAERDGVRFREHEPVRRLERGGDRVTAVQTAAATYRPGQVVVTARAWSGGLFEALGVSLPTRPVKGQMLMADCRESPVRTPLCRGEALVVPQPDGRLALGVTVEEAGYDDRVTLDGLRAILDGVCALVPEVGRFSMVRAWAGLRPATPDGCPYMGPVPTLRNLWISTGHFRKGVLLAPVCARLLARSILDGRLADELLPFRPDRPLLT
jgi:glycine oxidase